MHFSPARFTLIILALLVVALSVSAQTVTLSGRVTEQTTGQGLSGVAVVAEGNATGTRVVVTDAQGNYTLSLGANNNIKLRPYKTTYNFNPLMVVYVSSGAALSGSFTQDFAGSSFPVLIFALPPVLLTEDNSLNALVLDNVIQTREPFPITNNDYFGSDKRTRLTLLLIDLDLYQGETLSVIIAQAQDPQFHTYNLVVEDLRKVPNFPWLSQLTVRLPPELAGVASATLTVMARGQTSNRAGILLK